MTGAADSRRQQDARRRQQAEAALLARWGEAKISPSRDRILRLLDLLGQPQRSYRAIHLTGTNGKTSTYRWALIGAPSRLIRSVASWRCGLVYRPVRSPISLSSASTIRAVEVLPFVPVRCTTW